MSENKEVTPRSARSEDFYEVSCEAQEKVPTLGSPHLKGMDLDLSLAPRKDEREIDSVRVQEEGIVVNFELPDGSYGESSFKLGQTVEVLKSYVESEFGIPMDEQVMTIEGKSMLNPLSLMDFTETKGVDEILISVQGPMPACRK
jgi:hypothetical protein